MGKSIRGLELNSLLAIELDNKKSKAEFEILYKRMQKEHFSSLQEWSQKRNFNPFDSAEQIADRLVEFGVLK